MGERYGAMIRDDPSVDIIERLRRGFGRTWSDDGFGHEWQTDPTAYEAARTIETLRAEIEALRNPKPPRAIDAFTVQFEVTLDIPDPQDRASFVARHTTEQLHEWLDGLVCNAPPKGVTPTVVLLSSNEPPF